MDEALKEEWANAQSKSIPPVSVNTSPPYFGGAPAFAEINKAKETPVAAQTASTFWTTVKKWLTIHPKVKAAFLGVLLVAFASLDNAYNGGESYRQAAHEAGGAALVAILAYLKSA